MKGTLRKDYNARQIAALVKEFGQIPMHQHFSYDYGYALRHRLLCVLAKRIQRRNLGTSRRMQRERERMLEEARAAADRWHGWPVATNTNAPITISYQPAPGVNGFYRLDSE